MKKARLASFGLVIIFTSVFIGCKSNTPKIKRDFKSPKGCAETLLNAMKADDMISVRDALQEIGAKPMEMKDEDLKKWVKAALYSMGVTDLNVKVDSVVDSFIPMTGGPLYVNMRMSNGRVVYWVFKGTWDGVRVDLHTPGIDASKLREQHEASKYIHVDEFDKNN